MKERKAAPSPNYTQSPNVFYDEWLAEIKSLAELKVVNLVIRFTFGWHVSEVLLSLTIIEHLAGMTRVSAHDGVTKALEHGYIIQIKRGNSFGYRLNVEMEEGKLKGDFIQGLRFRNGPDGPSPETFLLKNAAPKSSIDSIPVAQNTSKESIPADDKESIPESGIDSKPAYNDKEKGNKEENKTTTTTALAPPDSSAPILCPKPFIVTPEMRAWAAINAPLVTDLETATKGFINFNRKQQTRMLPEDWPDMWEQYMCREQGFKERDARRSESAGGATRPPARSRVAQTHAHNRVALDTYVNNRKGTNNHG